MFQFYSIKFIACRVYFWISRSNWSFLAALQRASEEPILASNLASRYQYYPKLTKVYHYDCGHSCVAGQQHASVVANTVIWLVERFRRCLLPLVPNRFRIDRWWGDSNSHPPRNCPAKWEENVMINFRNFPLLQDFTVFCKSLFHKKRKWPFRHFAIRHYEVLQLYCISNFP